MHLTYLCSSCSLGCGTAPGRQCPTKSVRVLSAYDLKLDDLLVEHDGLNFLRIGQGRGAYKVDADGIKEVLIEGVFLIDISKQSESDKNALLKSEGSQSVRILLSRKKFLT